MSRHSPSATVSAPPQQPQQPQQIELTLAIELAQALSGELAPEALAAVVLAQALRHGGAARGAVLLAQQGGWTSAAGLALLPAPASLLVEQSLRGGGMLTSNATSTSAGDGAAHRWCLPLPGQDAGAAAAPPGVVYLEGDQPPSAAQRGALALLAALAGPALGKAVRRQALELARAEAEDRSRLLGQAIDTVPCLIWGTDAVGNVDFLSQRWLSYTGLQADYIYGTGWTRGDVVHPDDLARLVGVWREALATVQPGECEARLRCRDGSYRWFQFRAMPQLDEDGELLGWWGVNTDIEEKKHNEELLAGERRLLEMIATGEPLQAILDACCRLFDSVTSDAVSSLLLLDHEGKRLLLGAAPNMPQPFFDVLAGTVSVGLNEGACGTAAFRGEAVYTDISTDPVWDKYRELPLACGLLSCWSTPIMSTDHRLLGVLGVHSRRAAPPTALQQNLMARFTHLAGIVIERSASVHALYCSEKRYQLAVDAAGDGHTDWIVATDSFYASPRFLEMCGMPVDTVFASRADFHARFPFDPDDKQRVIDELAAHFAGDTLRLQLDMRLKVRGELRWMTLTGLCSRDAQGRLTRWNAATTDITDRVRAESALRASEERYALAMGAAGEGHWDWNVRTDEFYASPRMLELHGFPPDTVFASRDDFQARVPLHPEDRPRWERAIAEHFAGRSKRFEMEMRTVPRGEVRWLHVTGLFVRDAAGAPVRWTGALSDITQRKRVEEELLARRQMLELAQQAAGAVPFEWHIGAGAGVDCCSHELGALLGLGAGDYDGSIEGWLRCVHPDDVDAVREALAQAYRSGVIAVDHRVLCQAGSVCWLQARGRVYYDDAGAPQRMVGFMLDDTERQQAREGLLRLEQQLRLAQRLEAMGTLAGGIAHDFNNILASILGYGEMALRDAAEGSRLRRDLVSIVLAGERGRALVDRILAFSRSGMGERVAVHVEAVARETMSLVAAQLPDNVRIESSLRAGRAAMLGDATQVHQVMMNLAMNGVQAMPGGGVLHVGLEARRVLREQVATIGTVHAQDYLVLTVRDTGGGIAPDILERIFDPFFTTKDIGVGTGLGLSLVHGIVAELGGAIDVVSAPDAGSTFTVYLPRDGEAEAGGAGRAKPPQAPRGHGRRVIVVDDEPELVRLMSGMLEELGYRCAGFPTAAQALAALSADPAGYDALVTDERMPGVTGSDMILAVRDIRADLPLLLVSGYLGPGAAPPPCALGVSCVLRKPFSAAELGEALGRALGLCVN